MKHPKAYKKWRKRISSGLWWLESWCCKDDGWKMLGERNLLAIWQIIEDRYLCRYKGLLNLEVFSETGIVWTAFPGSFGGLEYHIDFPIPPALKQELEQWQEQNMAALEMPGDEVNWIEGEESDGTQVMYCPNLSMPSAETMAGLELRGLELALALRPHIPPEYYLEYREFQEIVIGKADGIARELPCPDWVENYPGRPTSPSVSNGQTTQRTGRPTE